METVIIIGAGASGMMAALSAAEEPDRKVILLERQQRVGRKLLSTGNGRCNLTNTGASIANYHGEEADFPNFVLSAFPPDATLDFFRRLGLLTVEEYGGRVYPLSNSANSVVDVLRFSLESAGVELHSGCTVTTLRRSAEGFLVETDTEKLKADKLIIACGSAAGAKLGGVSDGYRLLSALGHKRTKLAPALVQLTTSPEYPRALKGIRADAGVQLLRGERCLAQSAGELQFTEKGVSGPAVFDISRCASTEGGELSIRCDFMRGYSLSEVKDTLMLRREKFPELSTQELFTGMLHNRLGRMLVKYSRLPAVTLKELSQRQLEEAARGCKEFELQVNGTEGFDNAQICAGGIKTAEFDPKTLESRLCPGLFACGEVLDVDGDCGGFNLQWAWASGRIAGRLGK